MPKRLEDALALRALAAGEPPKSSDIADDNEWHTTQDEWLREWGDDRKVS